MARCKFRCYMNRSNDGEATIRMHAVYDDKGENSDFFKATPAGSLELMVVNPEAAAQIEEGKEYYIDITAAE